eukprot:4606931-Lingulodinium_polyedra.AAC.1
MRRAQNASRHGGAQQPQPRHCVTFLKRYTTTRSRSLSAATAARILRASHAPCEHHFLAFAWRARRAQNANRCGGE